MRAGGNDAGHHVQPGALLIRGCERRQQQRKFTSQAIRLRPQNGVIRSRLRSRGGGSQRGRKVLRRSVWVVHGERVRDRLGLKAHGRLCVRVRTGFDHPTHYPVQVGRPDCGEDNTENGDKIGDVENVGTTRPTW